MAAKNAADVESLRDRKLDEELADVLVAISVITKRLARKINENLKKMEVPSNEQDERTVSHT
ncbi:MAG: hypothetical protein HFI06_12560 [Eubacterium sp.]|jgi:NTP pyrophosphatase (non-canonical NTP hydrolase)|nr:hypothetical protein [Eubacterium sp.]